MTRDPYRETDDEARRLARDLIAGARFAALAVTDPADAAPVVSRIAVVPGPDGLPLGLVSELSHHTAALKAAPLCSLMVGEPGPKGDPLTHPRLTVIGAARFVPHGDPAHPALAAHFTALAPKAGLYIGFGDFALLRFDVRRALLNGGFGKAYRLGPEDLTG